MFDLVPMEVPLTRAPSGDMLVSGTSVRLDDVLQEFEAGVDADEIVQRHAGLRLDDLFVVLGFCLKHRKQVERYLRSRPTRHSPAA